MPSALDTASLRFRPGTSLDDYPTRIDPVKDAEDRVAASVEQLSELQELLWADQRHAILLVFQGMDCAGKDGTIKHVTRGVNPAGFQVVGFRAPSHRALKHDFLWRYARELPERGRIGIFNRSYYEEVLVVRVHPEMLDLRPLPEEPVDAAFWQRRLEAIAALERHLTHAGTTVLKFFLHLSPEEQRQRLESRLTNQEKLWKFDPQDLEERQHWDAYQAAFEAALTGTHTEQAPWFVIPADDKWTMRALVAQLITEEIGRLPLAYPNVSQIGDTWIEAVLKHLASDSPKG